MKIFTTFFCLSFLVTNLWAQQQFNSPENLKAWLPSEVVGYVEDPDNHSSEQQLQGNIYFIAAKQYKKAQESISVVIIDYRQSSTAITSVTSDWEEGEEIDNDFIQSKNIAVANDKAKVIYDKKNNSSQLYLYHTNQYLITLTMKGSNTTLLQEVATILPLSRLP